MTNNKIKKFRKAKNERIEAFEKKQDVLADYIADDSYSNGRTRFSEFL